MINIIGCGGVGSWLAPAMCRLVGDGEITLIDGDKLEKKNLDRQLFSEDEIGSFKSDALAKRMGCVSLARWYSETTEAHNENDWLMCAVDNHPARLSVLRACDICGCSAIFAANETHSSEAFVYLPEWKGTRLDPRVYYPEIASDKSNDPRARSIGCTGEAQRRNRQLVTANMMAASLAAHLFVVWELEARKIKRDVIPFLPYKLVNNLTKMESTRVGELVNE